MRSATFTVTWPKEFSHPIDHYFHEADDASLQCIRYATPSPDGQFIQFVEVSGDPGRARELLEACPEVVEYAVVETAGNAIAYMQSEAGTLAEALLLSGTERELIVDWPVHYLDDRWGLRVRLAGDLAAMQASAADLPDEVSFQLERIGQFRPEGDDFGSPLTDRQRQLLAVAEREGYYSVPRETTQAELAELLDLAPATLSERLQRIEANLARGYLESG
ncbi:helix-turn-helix domain-containing protein [Haloglomus litoreum]|uniref:helix-turn-helix domain-containing protein n=1 Tax=Haloglomus litoreum TaxID=3034026 RepID=UPI0023E87C46|nr:helix-turn-helix domain-containing protein [Haloglomus sp. DT116]